MTAVPGGIRVKVSGLPLVLTGLSYDGIAVPVFTSATLSSQVTFPLNLSGDTTLWIDGGWSSIDLQLDATLGGVQLDSRVIRATPGQHVAVEYTVTLEILEQVTALESQVLALQSAVQTTTPQAWTSAETVLAGQRRTYAGYSFQAVQDVPTGIAPTPIGDGSATDRALVLAGRCGYAEDTVGGDQFPTLTVTNTASSGAGSFDQAIADAWAAGGGYIVWDGAGGASGVYLHSRASGQAVFVPPNTTINGWGADVTFTGFGEDDATTFSIGGISANDFTTVYGSTPVHDVIVTGIKFDCNNGVADSHGDVIAVRWWARNVWIDHCYATNPQKLTDGLLDITYGSTVTVSWSDLYQHHKASLAHSTPIVGSPTGNSLPPGVTKAAPGPYNVQTVNGVDVVQNRVTYVHCLFDGLAQRSPLVKDGACYVHLKACWVRNFGNYSDGTNPAVNGLNDWPITTGARWSEVANPGPSLGPTGAGTSVPGTYIANTGGGSKCITGAHLLVEDSTYTAIPGTTTDPIANDGAGNVKTSGNTYTNCTPRADLGAANVPTPPYAALDTIPANKVTTTLRYGVGVNAKGYWTLAGDAASTPTIVPGQELGAPVEYWPATANATNATTTATTATDLSALGVAATWAGVAASTFDLRFVAPPSGSVIVRMSMMQSCSGSDPAYWSLYDVGAAAAVANSEVEVTNTSAQIRPTYEAKITGLTPGQTYTWRPQVRLNVNTQTLTLYSGGNKGAVRVQAFAAV